MNKHRLTTLVDGIFAIVMTLLVIEIRIPSLGHAVTNGELWVALAPSIPTLLSFLLSFVVLFTYWRSHHFIFSGYAQTIDSELININALFLFFVTLVPLSSAILGLYSTTQLSVILFSLHVIVLGLILYWMRNYILFSDTVKNRAISIDMLLRSNIRVAIPIIFAILAIPLSFLSIKLSLFLLTIAVIFNLLTQSSKLVAWMASHLFNIPKTDADA